MFHFFQSLPLLCCYFSILNLQLSKQEFQNYCFLETMIFFRLKTSPYSNCILVFLFIFYNFSSTYLFTIVFFVVAFFPSYHYSYFFINYTIMISSINMPFFHKFIKHALNQKLYQITQGVKFIHKYCFFVLKLILKNEIIFTVGHYTNRFFVHIN